MKRRFVRPFRPDPNATLHARSSLADSPTSALQVAIDEIVAAASAPDRLKRIALALRAIVARAHVLDALMHEVDDDEVVLHASDTLTIYHLTLTPGLQYPPHDHGMDALIGLYRGSETNFVYPKSDGRLCVPERREATAPAVIHLAPEVVHAVANTGASRSGALHVYLGDLPRARRRMWRFSGGRSSPFDNDRYLAGARFMVLRHPRARASSV